MEQLDWHNRNHTVVRIVGDGPGWRIVEADCNSPMADGRMFSTVRDAMAFAHGYSWVIDTRTNGEVHL